MPEFRVRIYVFKTLLNLRFSGPPVEAYKGLEAKSTIKKIASRKECFAMRIA
jgi:hypothetical protein